MRVVDSEHYLVRIGLRRDRVPSFDDYPFCLPVVRNLTELQLHPKVTYFIGENGTGKSTLLEAVAVAYGLNPEGGSRNFAFSTRSSHSDLFRYLRVVKGIHKPKESFFLRAESFFNLGTEIERLDAEPSGGPPIIGSYGGRSLHEQSHGESFFALFMNRFRGNSLFILDEPEAALSPVRQMAFLSVIHDLLKAGSQFIIATHSPIILAYPESVIFELSPEGIRPVPLDQTDPFVVTKDFLNNPRKALDELLQD